MTISKKSLPESFRSGTNFCYPENFQSIQQKSTFLNGLEYMALSIRETGENIKNSPIFEGSVEYDVPMSDFTTMKVGGNAELVVCPKDPISMAVAASVLKSAGTPIFVLGGGSNTVIRDGGISGAVIRTDALDEIYIEPGKALPYSIEDFPEVKEAVSINLTAGSGTTIKKLTEWCAKYGITGVETFAGLPGTFGGAVFMNARCYGTDFSSIIQSVEYVDLDGLPADLDQKESYELSKLDVIDTYTFSPDDWDYKKSPFQGKNWIITAVTIGLKGLDVYVSGKVGASPAVCDYITRKNSHFIDDRKEKGQLKAPSAGSVFKNNHAYGKPSGQIIDELGLKGKKIGGAQVAPWHGNFIINTGNATAYDVEKLVNFVKSEVADNTGFILEPEVIFAGNSKENSAK